MVGDVNGGVINVAGAGGVSELQGVYGGNTSGKTDLLVAASVSRNM